MFLLPDAFESLRKLGRSDIALCVRVSDRVLHMVGTWRKSEVFGTNPTCTLAKLYYIAFIAVVLRGPSADAPLYYLIPYHSDRFLPLYA